MAPSPGLPAQRAFQLGLPKVLTISRLPFRSLRRFSLHFTQVMAVCKPPLGKTFEVNPAKSVEEILKERGYILAVLLSTPHGHTSKSGKHSPSE